MATYYNIGRAGEKAVVDYLRDVKGFANITGGTELPGGADIDAIGSKVRLLIQVKAAVHPNKPAQLTDEEVNALVSRASEKKAQAWEARVFLDHNLQVIKGGIEFRLLS